MCTSIRIQRSRLTQFAILIGIVTLTSTRLAAEDNKSLVVHEWGTFTSLQDERGIELAGINTDDEPVPPFVHNLNPYLLSQPVLSSLHWQYRQKGAPRVHPQITMRLETPVIYFHPPKEWPQNAPVDVSVQFRGGWLTEFYPQAKASAPGLAEGRFNFGELAPETVGQLEWNDLSLGSGLDGPSTDQRVWLVPRQVRAADISTTGGESERYLFYRGVGRIRAPLRAKMDRQQGLISLHANFDEVLSQADTAEIRQLWLVYINEDGECAFRTLKGFNVSNDTKVKLSEANYRFAPTDFQPDNIRLLTTAMQSALVRNGLSNDEATALLGTWKRSYFVSPGLRIFYLVPREWTERYLPLAISPPSQITRVMVGRLELITDHQRALLDRLPLVEISDGSWIDKIPPGSVRDNFLAGRTDTESLGVPIPVDFQMYLKLGRFRNALLAHEEHLRPSVNLSKFIDTYKLHPFRLPSQSKTESKAHPPIQQAP